MVKRDLAAVACDMSIPQFERAVTTGELPAPRVFAGEERWSVAALEAAINPSEMADWEKDQPGLNRAA